MISPAEKSLFGKMRNLIARGVVKLVNDALGTQVLQVTLLADEARDNIENAQPYGLTYNPPAGAECIAIFYGGNRDHGSVLTVFDKKSRPKNLPVGAVCLYDAHGSKILLKNNGEIEIKGNVKVIGDLDVTGNIRATQDISDQSSTSPRSMSSMRAAYNRHTHPDTHGGNTGQPNNPML